MITATTDLGGKIVSRPAAVSFMESKFAGLTLSGCWKVLCSVL